MPTHGALTLMLPRLTLDHSCRAERPERREVHGRIKLARHAHVAQLAALGRVMGVSAAARDHPPTAAAQQCSASPKSRSWAGSLRRRGGELSSWTARQPRRSSCLGRTDLFIQSTMNIKKKTNWRTWPRKSYDEITDSKRQPAQECSRETRKRARARKACEATPPKRARATQGRWCTPTRGQGRAGGCGDGCGGSGKAQARGAAPVHARTRKVPSSELRPLTSYCATNAT
jgi:hypothetical protein